MKKNVGKTDRTLRISIALVILVAHYIYYAVSGYYCVWANLAFIPLLTGLFRFCPAYLPFKINTSKKD